ncbi:MAG: hypothetical protein CMI16_06510 [Opitutaceae bacterium]|nr:hypothetical protein [Opitutaceae bacterium]
MSLSKADRNCIPNGLIDEEIDAWMSATPEAKVRVFLDVFGGYGSVTKRVQQMYPEIFTYTNDIARRDTNDVELDIRTFGLSGMVEFAAQKLLTQDDLQEARNDYKGGLLRWMKLERGVAFLFHLSTPCETYSTAAGGTHRKSGDATPVSAKAKNHDHMNSVIIKWLRRHALSSGAQ